MLTLRLLALAALLLPETAARAAENKYDVLARLLLPFASLLAERPAGPHRAVQLSARLEAMTGLPAALAGTRVELALQHPDKLRLRAPILGEILTLCRNGQSLWVAPSSKAEALLAAAIAAKKLPPLDRKARLAPFRLPIPEKQLVFLPALFRVEDGGSEAVDGDACRVLGLSLMPELERSLKSPGWNSWVWVRENGHPARLTVEQPDWKITVRFDRVEFSKSLPPETWQPSAEEAADVLQLDPPRYQQLIEALMQ